MNLGSDKPYVEVVPTARVGMRVASGSPGDTRPAGDPGTVPSGSGGSGLPFPLSQPYSHGPLLKPDGTPFIHVTPLSANAQTQDATNAPSEQTSQQPPPQVQPQQQQAMPLGALGYGAGYQGGPPGRGPGGPGGGGWPFTAPEHGKIPASAPSSAAAAAATPPGVLLRAHRPTQQRSQKRRSM